MTTRAGREGRIINALLTICLAAGFACFLLFALPDQLRKARAYPADGAPRPPTALSAIIPLDQLGRGPAVREDEASVPATAAPAAAGDVGQPAETAEIPGAAADEVAGGAGAAIDDQSAEASEALASREEPSAPAAEAAAAAPGTDATAAFGGAPEFKAHAVSSLARRDAPAAEADRAKGAKGWLATPPGLEADVAFWRDIYAKYDRSKVVLHHPRYLDIVYDVVNLVDIDNDPRLDDLERQRMRENRVGVRSKEITAILTKLAQGPRGETLSADELHVRKLFANVTEEDKFRRAAEEDGVRSQTGQRDKFIPGLKSSGRYLGEIEEIFAAYGLPRELTRIVFVESMFNLRAVSKTGASGIWQFMPGTGRLYLQMNDFVDERNDPVAATHAAAKLLRHNYEELGSWPLAINAYNAGRGRLKQAIAQMGTTDIGRIIRGFAHPAYGFASRNFFLEFLAALDVAEHAEQYFGPIAYDPPLRYQTVRANATFSLPDVARIADLPLDLLLELNPAFTAKVASGQRPVPAGFALRVPEGKGELFLAAAARAPQSRTGALKHVVRQGESLQGIARMYGVEPRAIVDANTNMGWRVRQGQTILVPVGAGK